MNVVAVIHARDETDDEWPVLWRRACGCRVTQDDHGRTYAVVDDPKPGASRATIGPFLMEEIATSTVVGRCPHRPQVQP